MVEKLYDHNIESNEELSTQDVLSARLQLSWELQKWRDASSSFVTILSDEPLLEWTLTSFDTIRFQIILSIFYYRTVLLINAPVLVRVLDKALRDQNNLEEFKLLLESAIPAIETDFFAAQQLQRIIQELATSSDQFIDRNALWYVCNYTSEWRTLITISIVSESHG